MNDENLNMKEELSTSQEVVEPIDSLMSTSQPTPSTTLEISKFKSKRKLIVFAILFAVILILVAITSVVLSTPNTSYASWSTGDQIDRNSGGLSSVISGSKTPNALEAVSCPTISFCVAVDDGGYALTYTNGSWNTGQLIAAHNADLSSVSCPDSNFCVAVDGNGDEYTYSDGSWNTGQLIAAHNADLSSVSCPDTNFCVAVDGNGDEYTYSDGSWSNGVQLDSNNGGFYGSVSCPTKIFCVAMLQDGDEYTYSDGSWSNGVQLDSNVSIGFQSVSCASPTFCIAVHQDGYEYTYSDGSWSSGSKIGIYGDHSAISCASVIFCVALSDSFAKIYNGSSWSSPVLYDLHGGVFTSVSCATAESCVATDGSGVAFTYALNRNPSSPSTALNAYYLGFQSHNSIMSCSQVQPIYQERCMADSKKLKNDKTTGSLTSGNYVVHGNRALVASVGRICSSSNTNVKSSCMSNSNPNAGLPSGSVTFDQAWDNADKPTETIDNSAWQCTFYYGTWYVVMYNSTGGSSSSGNSGNSGNTGSGNSGNSGSGNSGNSG